MHHFKIFKLQYTLFDVLWCNILVKAPNWTAVNNNAYGGEWTNGNAFIMNVSGP